MKTMALTAETVPTRTHSRIFSVVSPSRPQSSALRISRPCPGISSPRFAASAGRLSFSPVWVIRLWVGMISRGGSGTGLRRSPAAGKELLQPLHLLSPAKRHQLGGNRPRFAPDHGPQVSATHGGAIQNVWLLAHLVKGAEKFPQGMAAQNVVS